MSFIRLNARGVMPTAGDVLTALQDTRIGSLDEKKKGAHFFALMNSDLMGLDAKDQDARDDDLYRLKSLSMLAYMDARNRPFLQPQMGNFLLALSDAYGRNCEYDMAACLSGFAANIIPDEQKTVADNAFDKFKDNLDRLAENSGPAAARKVILTQMELDWRQTPFRTRLEQLSDAYDDADTDRPLSHRPILRTRHAGPQMASIPVYS